MLTHGAFALALVCVQCQSLFAEPSRSDCRLSVQQPTAADIELDTSQWHSQWTDSTGAEVSKIPRAGCQAAKLRKVAIYTSLGNRDRVEILTARLRAYGVDGETVSEVANWEKLHK
jgi:hypothetical protein